MGQTLARAWMQRGFNVSAVHSRTNTDAAALAALVHAETVTTPTDVLQRADLTFLTVPDDTIRPIANALARTGLDLTGRAVVHTSGVHSIHSLDALRASNAMLGSLHPALPFADPARAISTLKSAAFALEAEDGTLRRWLTALVAALEGHPIYVDAAGKARYHAALVMLSNFSVTLYATAQRLLTQAGADNASSHSALTALLHATVENIHTQGIPNALTGPLVRNDLGTLQAHLRAVNDDDIRSAYISLARLTVPLLHARGLPTDAIGILLTQHEREERNHATNDNP